MSSEKKNVLVLQPVLGQPIYTKRINMMLEQGHTVRIAAFDRPFNSTVTPGHEVIRLGKIGHQQYLRRVPKLLAAAFKLRPLLKQCDVVYVFGIDLILLSMLAGVGVKYGRILEAADIREIQTRQSLVGSLFRKLDNFICKRLDLLVVTAPSFLNSYFRQRVGAETPALLIENKVGSDIADAIKKELRAQKVPEQRSAIAVGYFGLLQSLWSWRVLKLLAKEHPTTHKVLIAGLSRHETDLEEVAATTENLDYFGPYRSQEDLSSIYGQIDLSWACFSPIDPDDWKLRWARSNRFYEACAYERPLLSRAGSDEALEVEKYNIGLVIDEKDEAATVAKVAAITPEQISVWKKNMQDLPKSVYAYTDESEKLSQAIVRSANKGI